MYPIQVRWTAKTLAYNSNGMERIEVHVFTCLVEQQRRERVKLWQEVLRLGVTIHTELIKGLLTFISCGCC